MPAQIYRVVGALLVFTSCFGGTYLKPNISADSNMVVSHDERCERLSGKWLVFKLRPAESRSDCERASCGEYMGPIELSCSGQQLSGRALLGISRSQEVWTTIRARKFQSEVELAFDNEGCETTYQLSDFKNGHIFGDVSSTGCKLGDKDFRFEGVIFLKRPSPGVYTAQHK